MDLLLKEARNAGAAGKSVNEMLDQVRVIWTVQNREAVIKRLEYFLGKRHATRFPDELQLPVSSALYDLVRAAESLPRGDRHRSDLVVSRLIKFLDPENQIEVIAPWFEDSRKFRTQAVMRTLRQVKDLEPYAGYLVDRYREHGSFEILKLIARSPEAAAYISVDDLHWYFTEYLTEFLSKFGYANRSLKYYAMIAAQVLIVGNRPIPTALLRGVPEIFSWAIEEIGDPANEDMLIWIIVENSNNPEVLWSAIRTANRQFMPRALERALQAARELLLNDQGIALLPEADVIARS